MSRLNKRQLRAQQELADLADSPVRVQAAGDAGNDRADEEEDAAPPAKAPASTSLFAALGADDGPGDDEDEEAPSDAEAAEASVRAKKKKKPKKKKKAAAASEAVDEAHSVGDGTPLSSRTDSPRPAGTATSSGKKKKGGAGSGKGSAAGSASKGVDDMSLEELDALLASQAQIASIGTASGSNTSSDPSATAAASTSLTSGTSSGPALQARAALAITAQSLDPQVELRKQFGSAAIRAFEAEVRASGGGAGGAGAGGGNAASAARARAQARNPNLKIRSFLVQPKGEWPPVTMTKSGMGMVEVVVPGRGKCFSFVHSRAYLETQIRFLEAVHSHDANQLYGVFYEHPWHIDTLLQLSDISRHQGDLGQASDWNARAIWAFERAALPPFVASLTSTSGPPQLDFARKENRAFYLAAHRQVGFLGRRGTWRTALEWTKLLLGLDLLDPHAMLLWLDFLAIKAGEEAWFVEVLDKLDAARTKVEYDVGRRCRPAVSALDEDGKAGRGQRGALDWCVGLAYSRALALRLSEQKRKSKDTSQSDAALRQAIARHPEVVQPLAEKIGASLPPALAQHPFFVSHKRHSTEYDSLPHLLAVIYAHRSESLWKDGALSSWFARTAQSVFETLQSAGGGGFAKHEPASADDEARDSVYRHIMASDVPDNVRQTFLGFVPPRITAESSDACDPLPPIGPDGQRGNHDYFAPLYRAGGAGGGAGGRGVGLNAEAAAHGERVYEAVMAAHEEHPEELRNLMRQLEELQPQMRNLNAGNEGGGVLNRFGTLLDQLMALAGGRRGEGGGAEADDVEEEDWEDDEPDGHSEEEGDGGGGPARIPGGWGG